VHLGGDEYVSHRIVFEDLAKKSGYQRCLACARETLQGENGTDPQKFFNGDLFVLIHYQSKPPQIELFRKQKVSSSSPTPLCYRFCNKIYNQFEDFRISKTTTYSGGGYNWFMFDYGYKSSIGNSSEMDWIIK
jgi:hypothetical protein